MVLPRSGDQADLAYYNRAQRCQTRIPETRAIQGRCAGAGVCEAKIKHIRTRKDQQSWLLHNRSSKRKAETTLNAWIAKSLWYAALTSVRRMFYSTELLQLASPAFFSIAGNEPVSKHEEQRKLSQQTTCLPENNGCWPPKKHPVWTRYIQSHQV